MSTVLTPSRPTTPLFKPNVAPPKVSRRVARGIRYLDTFRPGWEMNVVPALIDLTDSHDCILGQVFGGFTNGVPRNRCNWIGWPIWGTRHGFCGPLRRGAHDSLENQWREYVSYRRGEVLANQAR